MAAQRLNGCAASVRPTPSHSPESIADAEKGRAAQAAGQSPQNLGRPRAAFVSSALEGRDRAPRLRDALRQRQHRPDGELGHPRFQRRYEAGEDGPAEQAQPAQPFGAQAFAGAPDAKQRGRRPLRQHRVANRRQPHRVGAVAPALHDVAAGTRGSAASAHRARSPGRRRPAPAPRAPPRRPRCRRASPTSRTPGAFSHGASRVPIGTVCGSCTMIASQRALRPTITLAMRTSSAPGSRCGSSIQAIRLMRGERAAGCRRRPGVEARIMLMVSIVPTRRCRGAGARLARS